ncbi:hypothetical protein C8Q78DRAFT_985535 [Trametes maxima]|nr:hypothetical protein C8Q78DRAFT_985535 [Trametes maxima]
MPNPSIPGPDDNPSLCWPDASGATSSRVLGPGTASSSVSRTPQHTPAAPIHKQPLMVQPGIWAESRQEVCESFDWFRSYQGGVYFNNDMVKGYLLSAFSSSRDMFARDGRLIISHGGGKAESIHSKKGQHEVHEADDQREEDKSVRALLRTYQMKRPLALIIDDRYALFPYDLAAKGYTYVVLGFYHIAHAWGKYPGSPASNGRGFVVRYKFAFEWCEKQPEPWWLKHTSPMSTVPPGNEGCNPTYLCATCSKSSPRVYDELGMCLRPNCPSFWSCDDHTDPPERLTYNQFFLDSRTECVHEMLEDIAPLPPAVDAADGVITSRRFCKGWHCKRCGRLSCRYKWEHWECKSCGTILTIIGKDRHAKEFRRLDDNGHFYHHKLGANSGIIARPLDSQATSGGRVWYHVYILPENRGRIYLIMGNATINGAAHEIFAEYQAQARSGELRFRRWPLRSHQCRGTLLTNYFSQNTLPGVFACLMRVGSSPRYIQYVGGTANTVPFQGAPSAVVKARDLIQERMATVMQADAGQYEFNEVLSAAYMEKQKMAGDVLIMDGAAIQEYYEHTVVPVNFRIAATARYISTSAE